MHRVTWKTYGKYEKHKDFAEYSSANKFFWFLQKQSWATHPELQSSITAGSRAERRSQFSLADW